MDRRLYLLLSLLTVALGAYLRLDDLGGPSLWNDEIIHLEIAEEVTTRPWYGGLIGVREVEGYTENGPIYYWLQILGQRLAPGETGARLFPALFGIVTLPLMARCGTLLAGRLAGWVSAFLLAVSPLHVYFSREGRPYSLLILLALALLYSLLQRGSRLGVATAYGGCLIAAYLGIHTVPILLAFLILSALALLVDRRQGRGPFESPHRHGFVAAILALGLVYGLYMSQSETNQVTFVEMRSPVFLSPLSRRAVERFLASMTTSGHPSVLPVGRSWVLLGVAAVALIVGVKRRSEGTLMAAGMFFLPAGLSFLALVAVGRWYALRYTSAALPAFLLLVAVGIVASAGRIVELAGRRLPARFQTASAGILVAILVGVLAAPNVFAARTHPQRKLDWRGVAEFVDEIAIDGEPIVVANIWPKTCLGYYLRGSGRDLAFINLDESVAAGEEVVQKTRRGWLLTAGFRESGDVRAWMHRFPPVLKQREEELALFFFPDFRTLVRSRFAAGRGTVFERRFAEQGHRFDFGGGELLLQGEGWSYQEQNREGIGYQWALGESADLALPIGTPRDARLRFRALPFVYAGASSQRVEVGLNGTRIAVVELTAGWSEHELEISSASWSPIGANILSFEFARTSVPAKVLSGSQDRRSLSAAFDYLEVVDAAAR